MFSWNEVLKLIVNHSDQIQKTTRPLRDHFGISGFFYVRLQSEGCVILTDRPDWFEYYAANRLYLNDPYLNCLHKMKLGFSFFTDHMPEDWNKRLSSWEEIFHLSPGLVYLQKQKNSVEFFEFAGHARKKDWNSFFLSNIPMMKSFCLYFKSKVANVISTIQESGIPFSCLANSGSFEYQLFESPATKPNISKFLADIGHKHDVQMADSLSSRERNCLIHLVQGKTAKQIGNDLDLSHRTVESYLENIKNKFTCLTKQELISIAKRLGDLGLFELY